MSITLNDRLYIADDIKSKSRRIKKRLTSGNIKTDKLTKNVYCIAIASNKNNLFDIMNVSELNFEHYINNDVHVVALAYGRDGAKELVARIIEDVYRDTNAFDVRTYFK